jgi:hypothetical protein
LAHKTPHAASYFFVQLLVARCWPHIFKWITQELNDVSFYSILIIKQRDPVALATSNLSHTSMHARLCDDKCCDIKDYEPSYWQWLSPMLFDAEGTSCGRPSIYTQITPQDRLAARALDADHCVGYHDV